MSRPKGAKSNPNRHRLRFEQREIERAIKAVQRRELPIAAAEVDPKTGKIKITIGTPSAGAVENSWDTVLSK
jgi:tmRNA-binding protein